MNHWLGGFRYLLAPLMSELGTCIMHSCHRGTQKNYEITQLRTKHRILKKKISCRGRVASLSNSMIQ